MFCTFAGMTSLTLDSKLSNFLKFFIKDFFLNEKLHFLCSAEDLETINQIFLYNSYNALVLVNGAK